MKVKESNKPKLQKSIFLFISGILFYDGINHLILAIKQSPYSVHGIKIGISGNWLIFALDIIISVILIYYFNRSQRKK